MSIIVDVEFRAPGRCFSLLGVSAALDPYDPEHLMLLAESIYALVPELVPGVLENSVKSIFSWLV